MPTKRLKSRRRNENGSKWARIAIAILGTVGLIDTGSITLKKWGFIDSLSCPGGTDGCNKVLSSAWGSITFGSNVQIPLSFFGFLAYFLVILMAISPMLANFSNKKINLTRTTWWGLFYSSCGMTCFSAILVGLMIYKINTFCFFCILSASISLLLFLLTLRGGNWDEPEKLFFRGSIFSMCILLSSFIWAASVDPERVNAIGPQIGDAPLVSTKSKMEQIALAKHLKDSGAVMYSAYWCPHCHDQKELFGQEAVKELQIIECAIDGKNNQYDLCQSKNIEGYPSWEINGKIESGVKSLRQLSKISNYDGIKSF